MIDRKHREVHLREIVKKAKLHHRVPYIQEQVLPFGERIDISQPQWLQTVLGKVLAELHSDEYVSDSYRQLQDALSAVIINYDSVAVPGLYGGRHTAALLNLHRFPVDRMPVSNDHPLLREQNSVETFNSRPETGSLDQKKRRLTAERYWHDNWHEYISIREQGDVFTLNNMVMRRAIRPRPVAIGWFSSGTKGWEALQALTPLAINLTERNGRMMVDADRLDNFVQGFAAMFDPSGTNHLDRHGERWLIEARSVQMMLQRLHRHFGKLGGSCFFSVPVVLHVSDSIVDDSSDSAESSRRAVISVLMNAGRNSGFYEVALQFFDSLANRVLTSVMASEATGYAHQRWNLQRASSAYWASHPLKHSIQPIERAAADIFTLTTKTQDGIEGDSQTGTVADNLKRLDSIRKLAMQQKADVDIAYSLITLQSLLFDLGSQERLTVDLTAGDGDHKNEERTGEIDLIDSLRQAAEIMSDRLDESVSVDLKGCDDLRFPIRARIRGGKLAKHADKEQRLYRTLFIELLKNAAMYGTHTDGQSKHRVDIAVSMNYNRIIIENAVHKVYEEDARNSIKMFQGDWDTKVRESSGLSFVRRILSTLSIGSLVIGRRPNGDRFPCLPPDASIWSYTLFVREH